MRTNAPRDVPQVRLILQKKASYCFALPHEERPPVNGVSSLRNGITGIWEPHSPSRSCQFIDGSST
jgi:hypothetical protein